VCLRTSRAFPAVASLVNAYTKAFKSDDNRTATSFIRPAITGDTGILPERIRHNVDRLIPRMRAVRVGPCRQTISASNREGRQREMVVHRKEWLLCCLGIW
jgi:hypothetical protein